MFLLSSIRLAWCSYPLSRVILTCFGVHITSLMVGVGQGYSAILIPQLIAGSYMETDSENASWIASLGVISNPIGALLAGVASEWCGRKLTIQLSAIPYMAGWFLISVSSNVFWLCFGRFVTGLAGGMITATFTYIAEITPAEQRGILAACGPVVTSFGVLLAYTFGYFLHWKTVALICLVLSFLILFIMIYLPESPVWLVSQNRNSEALNSLKWLRCGNKVQAELELDELVRDCCGKPSTEIFIIHNSYYQKTDPEKEEPYHKTLLAPENYKPFCILLWFFLFQELSGIYIILFYSVSFFEALRTGLNGYIVTIVVGCVRCLASIVGAILIHRINRKTLACLSGIGMAFLLNISAGYAKYYEVFPGGEENQILSLMPLVCILGSVILSMFGFLQLPYVMTSELFPRRTRGVMSGVVLSIANLFIFLTIKLYPALLYYFELSGILFLFGGSALLGGIFCLMFLPETKNRTLKQIENYFKTTKKPSMPQKSNVTYSENF